MKKLAIFALAAILAFGLCACRMGGNEPTDPTNPSTNPPSTTPSEPVATQQPSESDPIIDPTMDTNIPDPSVDNEHLIEPTADGGSAMPSPIS